jgi:tetratricopeptide (TPR) repeat protein
MSRLFAFLSITLGLAAFSVPAAADDTKDCLGVDANLDLAITACSALLQRNPKDFAGYTNRCYAYLKKGSYDLAIADCNRAIEVNPRSVSPWVRRGMAFEALGRRDEAIADYRTALRRRFDEDAEKGLKRLGVTP